MARYLKFFAVILFLISLPSVSAVQAELPEGLDPVLNLAELDFEFKEFLGKKVWVMGYYGDNRFTGDGVGFLVRDFHLLQVDEELPPHSFARLDGKIPPYSENGAEILVFGRVKDFGKTYNAFTTKPTPLVTVEEYYILTPPKLKQMSKNNRSKQFFTEKNFFRTELAFADGEPSKGTKASPCDRALVISGGIDDNNNKKRYKDNLIAKYKRLKELGFTDDQIDIVYNDGDAINVDGKNIVDSKATKENIKEIVEKYKKEMNPSCTLVLLVTDHGAGYSPAQGYHGARPAYTGDLGGVTYPEGTFTVDLTIKVGRLIIFKNKKKEVWKIQEDAGTGRMKLYKKVRGKWVEKGEDTNDDGKVDEEETGQDMNGDGILNGGIDEIHLGEEKYRSNSFDTDRDGQDDVRTRWDGEKFIIEIFKDGEWKKVGEDKNGDYIIDEEDGGVDWNGDGDTNDSIGFREGINLWGKDILWDDELADMLKELQDAGIHIMVEMSQCFSGGFIGNLAGIVEKIVTATGEDRKYRNKSDSNGMPYNAFQAGFLSDLDGIDRDSWNKAFDAGVDEDNQGWIRDGKDPEEKNTPSKWEKPHIKTKSTFIEDNGDYTFTIEIPKELEDKVYDIEIFFGLQKPRWKKGKVSDLPEGSTQENIPGGVKIKSDKPLKPPIKFKAKGAKNAESIEIHLTDKEHKNLGNITPVKVPYKQIPDKEKEDEDVMAPPKEKPTDDEVVKEALKAYQVKKRSVSPAIYIYKKDNIVEYQGPYRQDRDDVLDHIPELSEYKPAEESEPSDHE